MLPGRPDGSVRALAMVSRWATAVVANSEAGVRLYQRIGYRPRRWSMIPNGFDLAKFCPDPPARARLREELALPDDSLLIGLIARVDPIHKKRSSHLPGCRQPGGSSRWAHAFRARWKRHGHTWGDGRRLWPDGTTLWTSIP